MDPSVNISYALWLIPSESQSHLFHKIITAVARKFNSPVFAAHATLCSGEWSTGLHALQKVIDSMCREFRPILLDVDGLGQTNDYFRFFLHQADRQQSTTDFPPSDFDYRRVSYTINWTTYESDVQ